MKIHNRARDWVKLLIAPAVVLGGLLFIARIDLKEEFQSLLVMDLIPGGLVGIVVLVCGWPRQNDAENSKKQSHAVLKGVLTWAAISSFFIAWHCNQLIQRGGIPEGWLPF